MVMHPVGPLAASTYWRRRGVVLLAVLLVVLAARSCGGSPSRPTPGPTATSTPTPKPTPKPSASPAASPAAVPAARGCADADLGLQTTTDADTYAVGASPKITLLVKNTSAAACRRDLGSGAVELLVYSGADRIWSSDDCGTGKAVEVKTLRPGAADTAVKTWNGVRSKPGCVGSKAQARPGTYRVVARVGTLRVEGAVFRIRT